MPPASVAHAYQALVRTVEQDDMLGVRQPVNAFEAMHGAAFLRNEAFFAPDLLPPVLLHTSGRVNATGSTAARARRRLRTRGTSRASLTCSVGVATTAS